MFYLLVLSSFPALILSSRINASSLEKNNDSIEMERRKQTKIIWEKIIDYNKPLKWDVQWEKIENEKQFELKNNTKILNNNKITKIKSYDKYLELDLIDLGRSVPNADIINKGDLRISFFQIVPFEKAYYGGGTGNQNHAASIYYGLTDKLMIEGFISHSDDPLHKKINKFNDPVSNRWINYGSSVTWQFFNNNNFLIALNSSIENWNVKSGGCNTYNCDSTSNNMFSDKKEEIINNNLIGSISVPISYKLTDKLDFSLVPRAIFLPSKQSNQLSSGKFYGSSLGLGTGIEYKLLNNLKSYGSLYFPFGSGFNAFDENLVFENKTIYNAGLVYSLDTKIAIEAGLTNSFGLSPSTSTLSLPSSDQLLYKTSLIYSPKNIDLPLNTQSKQNRLRMKGLSVSTAEGLDSGEIYGNYYLNNNGSWAKKIVWGASKRFDFDVSLSSIRQRIFSDKIFNGKYHDIGKLFVRGGGKAIFLSQENGDLFTSAARVSAGRLRGTGWLFAELMNTYHINNNLSLNVNPKSSFSGIASPAAIGTSFNWQIIEGISLIPEYNFALKKSSDNWTIAIRYSQLKNITFDIFTTNSLNFIDTGQLMRSASNSYGFNIGYTF